MMNARIGGYLLLGLAVTAMMSINPRITRADRDKDNGDQDRDHHEQECRDSDHFEDSKNTPVKVIGVIPIPGPNPLTSSDIAWADPGTERYYVTDRANFGVDIINADDDLWEGRVTGMAGADASGGGTATTNGPGPNGVLVTSNRRLWAGDGNSTLEVADVDPNSSTYLSILFPGGFSTANSSCDGGTATTKYCGRADELAYDPKDHIVIIANNAPLSPTVLCPTTANPTAHCPVDPYATFVKADPPFSSASVLGHITFTGAGGLEQSIWDPERQRFLINVPGNIVGTSVLEPTIQVINPITMKSEESFEVDCSTIPGVVSPTSVSSTGIALAPYGHILISACGSPIVLTLKDKPTPHINILNVSNAVGGGDEVWYNSGDGRFYVTGLVPPVVPVTVPPTPQVQALGVLDGETGALIQTVSQNEFTVKGKNPAALPENNHIFTIQQISAAIVAKPSLDDSVCAQYGFVATGCIAVFEHAEIGEGKNQ
jgi:hypothetical protein